MENSDQSLTTDEQLITASAKGSVAAFTRIVEQHQGMVYRTCLRVLRSEADAKDAAQATFILLHQKCASLKQGTVLGGWLYRTAELVCREFIRGAGRRKRREEEALLMNETNTMADNETWSTLQPELDLALTALTPNYRDVVVLRYLEGKTSSETAEVLHTSVSVVTTRLARAMEQLRGWFQRRGVAVSAGALAVLLADNASAAAVPPSLTPSILSATAVGAAATAGGSGSTSLMVKGGLAKMSSLGWLLLHTTLFLVWMDCMNTWIGRKCPIPRWVHIFAAVMLGLGVAGTVALGILGVLTWQLAAGCILLSPAAAYIGWLWMCGPSFANDGK